jgi:hypothetical protein
LSIARPWSEESSFGGSGRIGRTDVMSIYLPGCGNICQVLCAAKLAGIKRIAEKPGPPPVRRGK